MTLPQIDLWLQAPGDDNTGRREYRSPRIVGNDDATASSPATPDSFTRADADADARLVADLQSRILDVAHAALDAIYRAHAPAIARFVYGYVHSREAAEDVVADVFLTL